MHLLSMRNTKDLSIAGADSSQCCVADCQRGPVIAVAGDDSGNTMMCAHHAMTWTSSDYCRDKSEDGPQGILRALSDWLCGGDSQAA